MSKNKKLIPELRFPEFTNEGEWEQKLLGEIGDFIGGGTPDTTKAEYWNGNIQWYTPTEVKEGIQGKSIRTITEEGLNNSSAKLLPKGALLITTRATIGDIAIANSECTTNQGFQSLVVNKSEENTFWYYWIIQHKNELKRKSSGSTFPEIGKNEIVKLKVSRPGKKEQQKIASCLSSLDEAIAAHRQKLDLLKNYKKGLMQNLFPQEGEKVPKYRFSRNNVEWKKTKLNKHIDLVSGFAFQSLFFSKKGRKLVIPKNFTKEGYANFNDDNTKYTTENFDMKYLCNEGDLLLLLTDLTPSCELLGKPVMLKEGDGEVLLNQRIVKVVSKTDLNKQFLLQFFLTDLFHKRILSTATGSTVHHSSNKIILDTELLIPENPTEQQKIASCLSSLDELITAQAEEIEQLNLHKKGLMQELFPKTIE